MKINKQIREISRQMLRASFTDGELDRSKITSLVQALMGKPRARTLIYSFLVRTTGAQNIDILRNYGRLLRFEIEKRHATITSASELSSQTSSKVLTKLKKKYGSDLTADFVVDPTLLGGMRVRVGSDVWDGTVRNRLQRLQQQL